MVGGLAVSLAAWLKAIAVRHHGPDGVFGRTWPTGTMAFWATVMLGAYLFAAFAR
jgi:multicomponent Na+:H+ antiporter subunit D